MKLSIVIPVYNEADTVAKLVQRVADTDLGVEKELILVEDCSTDGTRDVVRRLAEEHPDYKAFYHPVNQGKGAALRTGFAAATGDVVVVQDADMEYDPRDLRLLLGPILDGHADVVYGSRFLGGGPHRVVYFWHSVGNRVLTLLSNMFTDLNLTDMEVCYKMFRREVLQDIEIEEDRFGFEVEITSKVARGKRWRIYEVPVAYYGRSYAEGKKITWRDGFRALWCIVKYRLERPATPRKPDAPPDLGLAATRSLREQLILFLATAFGTGYSPVAPGTVGTLAGVLLYLLLFSYCGWFLQAVLTLALVLASIPICTEAERLLGRKDDRRIVLDEFATFPLCMIGIPTTHLWWTLPIAFLAHRVFDIIKPRPADRLQAVPGGWGIMLDDVVAAAYALLVNHMIAWWTR